MIDLSKSLRIGIDWLTIYNFKITYDEKAKIINEINEECIIQKIKVIDDLFSLDTITRLYEKTNKVTEYKALRFNPNKLLFNHNIYNSKSIDLVKATEKLKTILKKYGIEIDFKDAKIKEIEINCNFKREFSELKESFELLFIKSPNLIKISNYEGGISYKNMFIDRTVQGKWQTFSGIAYDKKKQISNLELLESPLSRLEWRFTAGIYNYYCKKKGLDNSLEIVIKNFSIVEEIFKDHTMVKLIVPAKTYIENKIKPELEKHYMRFKNTNKFARSKGIRQERNIFKYLEDNCWIFDKEFLIELISKYDKSHKSREIKRVKEKFFHHNNLEKLNYLMEIIF